jgi:hypothetical protein
MATAFLDYPSAGPRGRLRTSRQPVVSCRGHQPYSGHELFQDPFRAFRTGRTARVAIGTGCGPVTVLGDDDQTGADAIEEMLEKIASRPHRI